MSFSQRRTGCRLLSVLAFALTLFGAKGLADQPAESRQGCELAPKERQIANLLERNPEQAREVLECDMRLVTFARERAIDMAKRDYFGHVTPERKGPNELLRARGYALPKYYVGGIANSIESILAGEQDARAAWKHFLASGTHRRHLLGLDEMYAAQSRYGVAYLHEPESDFAHYWVVVIVEPKGDEKAMTCTPAPPICIVH